MNFTDLRLKRSLEIPPEDVEGGIFGVFFRYNSRQKVASDDYPVWLKSGSARMSVYNLVILGQTVLEIFDPLSL